jgi:hypothetical protein
LRAALLALVLLVSAGSAAATRLTPTPLTAEALLAANVPEETVDVVAGGAWWPQLPAFDSVVYRADPQPETAAGLTFVQLGGDATITATLYAFRSSHDAYKFLLYGELVGPVVDRDKPAVGDQHGYYVTTLPDGKPVTHFFFTRGRVGVAITVNRQKWNQSRIANVAQAIDANLKELAAGTLRAARLPGDQLAHMPSGTIAPGPVLGTATVGDEAWATVDRDGTAQQVRDGLQKRGAKLLFRRYQRVGSITDVIETTLFTFPKPADAAGWFAPFGSGVNHTKNSLDAGNTGPRAAYRHGRDNYELRFATGRYVADVFCYAPFIQDPSTTCEGVVRTLAERWYAQLAHAK